MPEAAAPPSIRLAPLPPPALSLLRPIRRLKQASSPIASGALIPLFYAALLYLAGIVLAHYEYLRPSYLLAGLLPLAAIAILAIAKAPRLNWLPIAAIWIVLGAWSAETEPSPAPDAAATLSDGLLRTVEGTVADAGPLRPPEIEDQPEDPAEPDLDSSQDNSERQGKTLRQRIDLELTAAEIVTGASDAMIPIHGSQAGRLRLSVRWPADPTVLECGQRLRAVVRIQPPEEFRDPGVWDRAAYLESQQIGASASVLAANFDSGEPRLTPLGQPVANSIPCLLNRARNFASNRLQSLPERTRALPRWLRATPADAAMLTALLTGDRTYLTRGIRVGFERTGSFHLIVVSGLHLAILAGCVFALGRRLRFARVPATGLTLAISLAYALFTGFAIPAQRGFWMIALYLIGRLLYRGRSPLNVVGFATLCLAAASPRSIFDASLQMTLLAVTAIAGIALPLLEKSVHARLKATEDLRLIALDPKLPPKIAQFRVTLRLVARHLEAAAGPRVAWQLFPFSLRTMLRFGELVFVTLVVELALALPMAMYFHQIAVYALPVNLLILPLLGLLVPAAMLLLVALALWPALAIVPAAFCLGILHLSVFVVRKLGALALGDMRVPDPATIQVASALLLFLLAVQLARVAGWPRRVSFAALALMAVAALWPRPIDRPANALLFEAIDVGQGDSLLLIAPDGKTLLVDAGGLGLAFLHSAFQTRHEEFDVGEEVVSAVLWSRGIRRLDAVALTHAHHDHMGGLPAILRNFHPRELWVGNNPPGPAYDAVLQEAASLGVAIRQFRAGDSISFGRANIRVLAPALDYRPATQPANNDSLVLQARFGAQSVLLAGDAEGPEERSMLSQSALGSTVLKVGHHGSITSTHPDFLAAVSPAWAVISCGRHNRFGHPRPEILAELQAAHIQTLRTDTGGATCLILPVDGRPVAMEPMCAAVAK